VSAAGGQGAGEATAPREEPPFRVGQEIEVEIADVAQGGWCVARPDGLPVMFVRHALPGERVTARVTEVTSKFARADAVRVLEASPDRVTAPCPSAHPGGCGGCDWQHASLPAQRALKAAVVEQQLRRLAGLDNAVTVEPLAGDGPGDGRTPGLGWRTRVQFAVDQGGVAGLRAHRSHRVVDVGDCLIAHRDIRALGVTDSDWSGATGVETAVGGLDADENYALTVVEDAPDRRDSGPSGKGQPRGRNRGNPRGGRAPRARRTLAAGRPYLVERAGDRLWQVSADGFWQVHPAAAGTLSQAVVEALAPAPGDTVLDLYCGAGLFAGVLAALVGPDGAVTGVESDPAAVKNARQNLADVPWASFRQADVAVAAGDPGLALSRLVVADPPRAGLAAQVISFLNGDSQAERFAYVSCDPATLARDLALLIAGGWSLDQLRAFDAFPMTHHVECVATLTRSR
jgi:tRNA/tmRNA/rRNA uracil-C5-methylase (TrmA/RlmC/RlmD family)